MKISNIINNKKNTEFSDKFIKKEKEQENMKNEKDKKKKDKSYNKVRTIIVILSLIIISFIIFFVQRAEYLNYIEAGSQYWKIYQSRTIEKISIFVVNFIVIYVLMFFVTKNMQTNLKDLFTDEKKVFPDLPTKSISFVIAIVVASLAQFIFAGDFLKLLNTTWFGKKDSVLSLDYSYYILIIPIIKKILLY